MDFVQVNFVGVLSQDLKYMKKGWLLKQRVTESDWIKHWFVLSGTSLKYYKVSQAALNVMCVAVLPDARVHVHTHVKNTCIHFACQCTAIVARFCLISIILATFWANRIWSAVRMANRGFIYCCARLRINCDVIVCDYVCRIRVPRSCQSPTALSI